MQQGKGDKCDEVQTFSAYKDVFFLALIRIKTLLGVIVNQPLDASVYMGVCY